MSGFLNDRELKLVNILLGGASISAAAEKLGVNRRTIHRWLEKPNVKDALDQAQNKRKSAFVESQSAAVEVLVEGIGDKVAELLPNAIEVYGEIIRGDYRPQDKIAAADRIVKLSGVLEAKPQTEAQPVTEASKGLSPEQADEVRRQILGISSSA